MLNKLIARLRDPKSRLLKLALLFFLLGLCSLAALQLANFARDLLDPRGRGLIEWLRGDSSERAALATTQVDACGDAPFVLPSEGFIGLYWGDPRGPYSADHPHQGIDIFSPGDPGLTPVYAAYDGYVRRESAWRSTLIMRVPNDPLQPSRQIWLYYTHMADRSGNDFIVDDFTPGMREQFVPQGTLLGYTGNYNGDSLRPIAVHLHFSIVRDANSRYTNELNINNTIDPSPYLGLNVNYACLQEGSTCASMLDCSS